MKKVSLMLFMLLMSLPAFVYAGESVKSIEEMSKKYDSSRCKECHAEIYGQWEKSHHARPLMGVSGGIFLIPVVNVSAFKVDDPKKATKANFPCFKCHLPHALDAADSFYQEVAEAVKKQDKSKLSKLQITCIVCHNEKAVLHRLTLGKPEADVIYGSKDSAHGDKVFTKVKKSVIMKQAVFCGQCHGTGPNFDAENPYQCATLYGNYLHTYIPEGGAQTCQECHMKNGDHLIAPNWNDRKQASEILKETINLDVQTLGYQFLYKAGTLIPMVVVNTKITHRAGHEIPNG